MATDSTHTLTAERGRSRPATVEFRCPRCERLTAVSAATYRRGEAARACPNCGLAFRDGELLSETAPLEECWICGNREFFVQRDFNRQLGLYIVVGMALVVLLVMLLTDHRVGIYVLLAVALIDLVIYRFLPDVTVCYLCNSLYRRFPRNDAHAGFYLGLEEKHKKLRQRWLAELQAPAAEDVSDGTA